MINSPALSVDRISKKYKKKKVLDDISFTINEGETFALIGLNGVGKTTLIKTILGLIKPDKGDIKIFGKSSVNARKNICYLPEKFMPPPNLSGLEFLEYSLSFHNSAQRKSAEIEIMASNLDLSPELLREKISKYSKGMGQKLGLISTFLSNAKLLIFDEPMSGLDPRSRIMLKNEMRNHIRKGGTIFFTSHILSDIEELCSHIAILDKGKIIYDGNITNFLINTDNTQPKTLEERFLEEVL